MVVIWSMPLNCTVAGCKFITPLGLGTDLKVMLETRKLHEYLVHPRPVRLSRSATMEEGILKNQLMKILECPVCLVVFKPPLKIWQCPQGHVICGKCRARREVVVCPQCRTGKKGNFSRNRVVEDISRELFPEVAGIDETTAQDGKEVAANIHMLFPEVRLPTYDVGILPTMSLPGFDVMFGN